MGLFKITKLTDNLSRKKGFAEQYAEQVLEMNNPKDEIQWLFTKLDKEEQENLIEIFDLNIQDNE